METYKEFLNRINSFEKREIEFGNKHFAVNPQLAQKVGGNNKFKNFYGDTVVFDLDGRVKTKISEYVDLLYKTAPQCFCERLNADTAHVTLHDLSNSVNLSAIEKDIYENERKLRAKTEEMCSDVKIKFKSKYLFNMVNTSLVLGLSPADESDYVRLMRFYSLIDEVKKLNYPFTPHITLVYYNVNGFDLQSAKKLTEAVNGINSDINFEFAVSNLYYQKFTSMNEYTNIFDLSKKPIRG